MYKAAGDAQQRVELYIVSLLLVLVYDIASLCLFPTPAVMGKIREREKERERFGCQSPLLLGTLSVP